MLYQLSYFPIRGNGAYYIINCRYNASGYSNSMSNVWPPLKY